MDCLYEGTIGKMLIYGRNATGKTNLSNYVERMQMITVGSGMRFLAGRSNQFFYELLEKRALLTELEEFLNVMGIECSLALKELPDGQKELYFVHKHMVPFYENASSGTLALFDLYRRLIVKIGGSSFGYLDEFDAFYHYEMAEKVIGFFKRKYPKCQMIMTSHNTNLMTNRIMRQKPEEEVEVCWLWRETMRKMSCFDLFSNVTRNCMLIWRTYGYNIEKAYVIQHEDRNDSNDRKLTEQFEQVDLSQILNVQNEVSQDMENGFIWVLNTCIFLIPDYNFRLIA